jgi:hypothetical protein
MPHNLLPGATMASRYLGDGSGPDGAKSLPRFTVTGVRNSGTAILLSPFSGMGCF